MLRVVDISILPIPLFDALIATVFVVYILACVVVSITSQSSAYKIRHTVRFLSYFNFFTSSGGVASLRFAYRDELENGDLTDWKFLDEISYQFIPTIILWNPKRCVQKTLDTTAYWLLSYVNDNYDIGPGMYNLNDIAGDINHFSYDMLIYLTQSQPHDQDAVATQFLITQTLRTQEEDVKMLCSKFYRLEEEDRND